MKKIYISPEFFLNKYDELYLGINKNWQKLFKNLKVNINFSFDNNHENIVKNYDILLLIGGGDISKINRNKINLMRDKEEIFLIKSFLKKKKPIIGICRGMQQIVSHFGGKLKKIDGHVKKNHIINFNKVKLNVNSFHNLGVSKLPKHFQCLAKSKDKSMEVIYSKNKDILGLMFHPERENKSQKIVNKLLKDFINGNCNFSRW